MKLTKENIKFIDDYLKGQNVEFWDVRIEMIDHIASKLEENDNLILDRTFLIKEFGTKNTLNKVVYKKERMVHNKYRKLYFKEWKLFFSSFKNILFSILFMLTYYYCYSIFEFKFFKKLSLVLFCIPAFVGLIIYLINIISKNNSVNLKYAGFYLLFSFFILNLFIAGTRPNGTFNGTLEVHKVTLLIAIPLNLYFSYCAFSVYKVAHRKYYHLFNKLKSI